MEGSLQAPLKLQMHVCFDPAILHRGIILESYKIFIAALFVIAKRLEIT